MKAHESFLIPKRIAGVSIPDSALAIEAGGPSMKIVVIGGSGLIGTKLVKRVREAGHEIMLRRPTRASTPSPARD